MGDEKTLRDRAEIALNLRNDPSPEDFVPSPDDSRLAIHELEVHKAELEMQNDEMHRVEEKLNKSMDRYFQLYNLAPEGFVTLGEKGIILEANFSIGGMLGVIKSQLLGQPITRFIFADDQDSYYLFTRGPFEKGRSRFCELRLVKEDGAIFWARLLATELFITAGARELFLAISDITERKLAEDQLLASHQENKYLLAELQHRAKNSFSLIAGMIGIAASYGGNSGSDKILDELSLHVRSVAELYTLLNSSGSISEIRLDDYCARVITPLVELRGSIRLESDLDEIILPVKMATPIGLILTELITNAIKHAFPDGKSGSIKVALRRKEGGASLTVADDGVGLASDHDSRVRPGMGLSLIRSLSQQIDGSFTMQSGNGTVCSVDFPLLDPKKPTRKTILLVEDDFLVAASNSATLDQFGYEVVVANTGEKAVKLATEGAVTNLILMDIDLGKGIDGLEASALILKQRNIPIVFLSSNAEAQTVDRARALSPYGYVIKNSGAFVLQAAIEMALKLFAAKGFR